jgi:hypothetical protein
MPHPATSIVPLNAVVVRTPTSSLSAALHNIPNLPYLETSYEVSIIDRCTGCHIYDFSIVLQVQHLRISLSRNFLTTIDYSSLYKFPPPGCRRYTTCAASRNFLIPQFCHCCLDCSITRIHIYIINQLQNHCLTTTR